MTRSYVPIYIYLCTYIANHPSAPHAFAHATRATAPASAPRGRESRTQNDPVVGGGSQVRGSSPEDGVHPRTGTLAVARARRSFLDSRFSSASRSARLRRLRRRPPSSRLRRPETRSFASPLPRNGIPAPLTRVNNEFPFFLRRPIAPREKQSQRDVYRNLALAAWTRQFAKLAAVQETTLRQILYLSETHRRPYLSLLLYNPLD